MADDHTTSPELWDKLRQIRWEHLADLPTEVASVMLEAADFVEAAMSQPQSPADEIERVARAIWRNGFQGEWDEAEIDRQWNKWPDEQETARSQAHAAIATLSAIRNTPQTDDPEEAFQIGLRDGYEKAVQDIDLMTGGDGEYRYCVGDHDPERHCPDADTMKARIVARCTPQAIEAGEVEQTKRLTDNLRFLATKHDGPGNICRVPQSNIKWAADKIDELLAALSTQGEGR